MRALVSHVSRLQLVAQVVAAVLVVMLAMGRGLPGIVSALHDSRAHVCTCAAGGDHASCPVCNKTLDESNVPRASTHVAVKGVPCGDGHVAGMADGEVVTLPAPVVLAANAPVRLPAPTARPVVIPQVPREPATPPPRSAAT